MSHKTNQAGFSRLASLVIAMIVAGAGLFLGFRAAQYFYSRPEPSVAEPQSSQGQAAREPEPVASSPVAPSSEPVIAEPAKDIPPETDLKTATDASTDEAMADPNPAKKPRVEREVLEAAVRDLPLIRKEAAVPPAVPGVLSERAESPPQTVEAEAAPQRPVRFEPREPNIIRKSGDVLQNTAAFRPQPVYPKAARDADIEGSVTVEVTISEEGSVIAARAITGPEQLREAALAAARRWKWMPARVDRDRARVVGTITFRFKD